MDTDVKGMLVTSFGELRKDEGLTIEKLQDGGHGLLLQMLGAEGGPEEGYQRLRELVLGLRDTPVTRAVRNALVIGDDVQPRKNLEARREWADRLPRVHAEVSFSMSRSTHFRNETFGFDDLAKEIIKRHAEMEAVREKEPGLDVLMIDPIFRQGFELARVGLRPTPDMVMMTVRQLRWMNIRTLVLAVLMLGQGAILMYTLIAGYPSFFFTFTAIEKP